jgi:hypothetical protein
MRDVISVFVEYLLLALIPSVLLAGAAFVYRSAVAWSSAAAWAL